MIDLAVAVAVAVLLSPFSIHLSIEEISHRKSIFYRCKLTTPIYFSHRFSTTRMSSNFPESVDLKAQHFMVHKHYYKVRSLSDGVHRNTWIEIDLNGTKGLKRCFQTTTVQIFIDFKIDYVFNKI